MRQRLFIIIIGFLLLVAVAGMVWTSEWLAPVIPSQDQGLSPTTIVDQRPLQTAQKLAALASTPEEQPFVQEALQIADQEVDLAFASALRNAVEHPPVLTDETRKIDARVKETQARVQARQDRVAELNKEIALAKGDRKDGLQQEIELARAQIHLDEDELAEAQEDLIRAGGDKRSLIQRMLAERQAAPHQQATATKAGNSSGTYGDSPRALERANSLIKQISLWSELRSKRRALTQAQSEARAMAGDLGDRYKKLDARLAGEKKQKSNAVAPGVHSRESAAAALGAIRELSSAQQSLTELGKQVQAETDLVEVYARWMAAVKPYQRKALYAIFASLAAILLFGLLVAIAELFVDRYFGELTPERRRLHTLRKVIRFAVQALGVVLILLWIFGPPNQLATVLALAGAGLTVALKDFIVGFFGWFVLMGRNGIRLGDWVEINGVGGEVVEIDLLHTVLLETGNWTDAWHPTGRHVSFVNSYAIEGHYFNFSTSGQWLWDELQVLVPSGEDPNRIAQAIQQIVTSDTEANARLAEQEWQRTTSAQRMRTFTGVPAVSVRPTAAGIEVTVRYITRASERHEVRVRLYQAVVELLQHKGLPQPMSGLTKESSAEQR